MSLQMRNNYYSKLAKQFKENWRKFDMCSENNNTNMLNKAFHHCDFCGKTEIVDYDDKDFEKKEKSWFTLKIKTLTHQEKKRELCRSCFYDCTPVEAEEIDT